MSDGLICRFCRKPILNRSDVYFYFRLNGQNEIWHKDCASKQGFNTNKPQEIDPKILEELFEEQYVIAQQEQRLLQKDKLIKEILLVSSPIFQDKTITKYFNVITSEYVIGTGFFSEADAFTSDIIGTRVRGFEEKLTKAKELAMKDIKEQAFTLGANAIVAVDIDYSTFSKNVLMVVVSGTPVITE